MFTLRSDKFIWLGAGHSRGHAAMDGFGLFDKLTGTLVTDDYNGYQKYGLNLLARGLCNIHLIRSARGVGDADPGLRAWSEAAIEMLRAARQAVITAQSEGRMALTDTEIEEIRTNYLAVMDSGIEQVGNRRWHGDKRHPGLVLAQ